ncbi:MAG TPA: response regulator, partial [Acidobacteriaceae bacterium]|nr:response regulator [Acidobacteriaceae bacterium]
MGAARILVVDDKVQVRSMVAAMLERTEYSTVLAGNGREAIQHIERDPPYDLVVSEVMISGLGGLGLLERVREVQPETPIVMVADTHDISVAMLAMQQGAYDYLLKPFERDRLLNTVRRAVEHRRLVQQNAMYRQNLEQIVNARTEMLNQAVMDLERSYDITLEALGDALDLKDAETEGHSKRVTAFTIALARGMGLPIAQIRVVARGAFLHDIGKMAIPDAILLKAGELKPEEQRI